MNREQAARERAMKRRVGASKEHAAKVKDHLLSQADLYTTCRQCRQRVTGTLADIQAHVEACHGGTR